jgi:hypothetical protein
VCGKPANARQLEEKNQDTDQEEVELVSFAWVNGIEPGHGVLHVAKLEEFRLLNHMGKLRCSQLFRSETRIESNRRSANDLAHCYWRSTSPDPPSVTRAEVSMAGLCQTKAAARAS